jgi:AmmeMemoRadiSam system protein A
MFTPEEKRELLAIARKAIGDALHGRSSVVPIPPEGTLSRPGGAFVTIRIDGNLRGCIGYIQAPVPLAEIVAEAAEKAALEDPRFSPLTLQEFEQTRIEISVLSPLQQIRDVGEILVGRHGLLLELRHARGLLLPQVAEEYGWDRETFLDNTARKAGLPRHAWKDPEAVIYVFTAEVIYEEELATRREGI